MAYRDPTDKKETPAFLQFLYAQINKPMHFPSRNPEHLLVSVTSSVESSSLSTPSSSLCCRQAPWTFENWNSWCKFQRSLTCCISQAVIQYLSASNDIRDISKSSLSSSSAAAALGIGNSRLVPSSWLLVCPSLLIDLCFFHPSLWIYTLILKYVYRSLLINIVFPCNYNLQ